jgi:hypothetical protein
MADGLSGGGGLFLATLEMGKDLEGIDLCLMSYVVRNLRIGEVPYQDSNQVSSEYQTTRGHTPEYVKSSYETSI